MFRAAEDKTRCCSRDECVSRSKVNGGNPNTLKKQADAGIHHLCWYCWSEPLTESR